ncbi:MAG TPA: response regulator [Terriglobales bacterium]|nr:response regulator [Terriglobales bacterium]
MRPADQPSVLLVEDEPGILTTFEAILAEEGFRVTAVATYHAAAPILRQQSFDAVITELNLEGNDLGLRLASELKKRKKPPAIVIYTGYPTVQQLREALRLRVDYVALKPVDLNEIKAALRRLIARRSASPVLSY